MSNEWTFMVFNFIFWQDRSGNELMEALSYWHSLQVVQIVPRTTISWLVRTHEVQFAFILGIELHDAVSR